MGYGLMSMYSTPIAALFATVIFSMGAWRELSNRNQHGGFGWRWLGYSLLAVGFYGATIGLLNLVVTEILFYTG